MVVVNLAVQVCAHGSVRVFPISEPVPVMFGIAAKINDDTHKEETNEGENLQAAKPKLELAKDANSEQVDEEDCVTCIRCGINRQLVACATY